MPNKQQQRCQKSVNKVNMITKMFEKEQKENQTKKINKHKQKIVRVMREQGVTVQQDEETTRRIMQIM